MSQSRGRTDRGRSEGRDIFKDKPHTQTDAIQRVIEKIVKDMSDGRDISKDKLRVKNGIFRRAIEEIITVDQTLYYGIDFSDEGFTISAARGRAFPLHVRFESSQESNNSYLKSAIYFPENGRTPIVGQPALGRTSLGLSRLVKEIELKAEEVGGQVYITWNNSEYRAEDLLRLIFLRLKARADESLSLEPPKPIFWQPSFHTCVTITSPLNWTDNQRQVLLQASRIAGFDSGNVISKVLAASINWRAGQSMKTQEVLIVVSVDHLTSDVAIVSCETNPQNFADVAIKSHKSILNSEAKDDQGWHEEMMGAIYSLCTENNIHQNDLKTILFIGINPASPRAGKIKQSLNIEQPDKESPVDSFELSRGAVLYRSLSGEGYELAVNAAEGLLPSQQFILKGIESSKISYSKIHNESLNAPVELIKKLESFDDEGAELKNSEKEELSFFRYKGEGWLEQGQKVFEFSHAVYKRIALLIASNYEDVHNFLKQIFEKKQRRKNKLDTLGNESSEIPFVFKTKNTSKELVQNIFKSLSECDKILDYKCPKNTVRGKFTNPYVEFFLSGGWLEKYCELVVKYVVHEIHSEDPNLKSADWYYPDAEYKKTNPEEKDGVESIWEIDSFLRFQNITFLFECKSADLDNLDQEKPKLLKKYRNAGKVFDAENERTFFLCSAIKQLELKDLNRVWDASFSFTNLTNFYDVVKAVITDCIRKSKRS